MDILLIIFIIIISLYIAANFKTIITFTLEFIINISYKLITFLLEEDIKIGASVYDEKGRFLEFFIENTKLLPHKKVVKAIYNKIMSNIDFLKFGNKKVIILFAKLEDGIYVTFHPNIFISNNTPFNVYYKEIEKYIKHTYDGTTLYGNIDQIKEFKLLVWNLDNLMNKNIKITLNTFQGKKVNRKKLLNQPSSLSSVGGNIRYFSQGQGQGDGQGQGNGQGIFSQGGHKESKGLITVSKGKSCISPIKKKKICSQ